MIRLAGLRDWSPCSERVDHLAEFIDVVHGQGVQVEVGSMQQHASQRPQQLVSGPGSRVAELGQPGYLAVRQLGIHA